MKHYELTLILAVFAAAIAWVARSTSRHTSAYSIYIDAVNTTDIGQGVPVYYGGMVTSAGQQMTTPYGQQPCVWYRYVMEEETPSRDANGNTTTSWRTVTDTPGQGVMFALQNSAGNVYVNPDKVDVHGAQKYQAIVDNPGGMFQKVQTGAMASIGESIQLNVGSALHKYRVTEYYVPFNAQWYVGGVAQEQNGQKVFSNDAHYPLVLSNKSRAQLVSSGRRNAMLLYVAAVVLLFGAVAALIAALKK